MAANRKSRCWQFTVNNYSSLPESVVSDCKRRLSAGKYWVIGKEIAPNTGTPHWQGFLWTHNAVVFNTVKAMLEGTGAHLTCCDNKAFEQMTYCKKDGNFEEWGTPPTSNKRKGELGGETQKAKYARIIELAEKREISTLKEEFPKEYLVMNGTIRKILCEGLNTNKELQGHLKNIWYWGESGNGKSSRARREYPGLYVKSISYDCKWWCGYQGEEVVLVEDLDKYDKKMAKDLKVWGDRYAFPCEAKGFSMKIRPERIIVTSQYRIDEIWDDEETRVALHRRYTEVFVDKATEEEARRVHQERLEAEKEKEEVVVVDEEEEEI